MYKQMSYVGRAPSSTLPGWHTPPVPWDGRSGARKARVGGAPPQRNQASEDAHHAHPVGDVVVNWYGLEWEAPLVWTQDAELSGKVTTLCKSPCCFGTARINAARVVVLAVGGWWSLMLSLNCTHSQKVTRTRCAISVFVSPLLAGLNIMRWQLGARIMRSLQNLPKYHQKGLFTIIQLTSRQFLEVLSSLTRFGSPC